MKKIFLLGLLFLSLSGYSQMATAPNQQIEIGVLRNLYSLMQASPSSSTSATTRTVTSSVVTSSATISTGAKSLGFLTSSAFTGSINGVPYDPDLYIEFHAPGYDLLPAMIYTVTTGSITINEIR